jgi:hypothetical protein
VSSALLARARGSSSARAESPGRGGNRRDIPRPGRAPRCLAKGQDPAGLAYATLLFKIHVLHRDQSASQHIHRCLGLLQDNVADQRLIFSVFRTHVHE